MCAHVQLQDVECRRADNATIGGSTLDCKYVALDFSNRDQNSRKLQQTQKHPNAILFFFFFFLKNKTETNNNEIKLQKVNN
jgi:hypothetical protein